MLSLKAIFGFLKRLLSRTREPVPSPTSTPLPAGLQAWRDAQADFNRRIEAARADHAKVRYIQEERAQFVLHCLKGSA